MMPRWSSGSFRSRMQMLLPVRCLARQADEAGVIGQALALAAAGLGAPADRGKDVTPSHKLTIYSCRG
jgi:hypothetical protein